MRLSELEGKEVIELRSGERLGMVKEYELVINLETGMVEALVLQKHGWGGGEKNSRSIPWRQIQKISQELLIFDAGPAKE